MSIQPQGHDKYKSVVKLLLLGDVSVGKSSILLRFADHSFDQHGITTIGIENRNVALNLDGKRVTLQIWDTAGQEKWRQIPPSYYRGVKAIVLVYDLSCRTSFNLISDWMQKISESTNTSQLTIALVGNKSDLQRQVSREEGQSFAQQHQMMFLQTSAKANLNVSQLFQALTRKVVSRKEFKKKISTKLNNPKPKVQANCC